MRIRGFTLIELVIVVAIIAILGGITATIYLSMQSTQGKAEVSQVATDLRYMQNIALTQHKTTTVEFATTSYTLSEAHQLTGETTIPLDYVETMIEGDVRFNEDGELIPTGTLSRLWFSVNDETACFYIDISDTGAVKKPVFTNSCPDT